MTGNGAPAAARRGSRFVGAAGPLGVAHRGASLEAPENTLAAFRRALDEGIRAVECDVRRTLDGQLVVIHDATVDRTTDGRGPVAALSLDVVRRLDAGRWFAPEWAGERVPRFEDVLDLVRGRALLLVEIKNDPEPVGRIEGQVVAAIRERGMEGDTFVMSFDHCAVRAVRDVSSEIATGILYAARLADPAGAARGAAADALCPQWGYLDAAVVRLARAAGLGVLTWTVDDDAVYRRCLALGIDGVTSNDIRLIVRMGEGG